MFHRTLIISVLLLLSAFPARAESRCKERSLPLAVLVNQSDAVAVVEKQERNIGDWLSGPNAGRISFKFESFLKPPLQGVTSGVQLQQGFFINADIRTLVGRRRFLVFLDNLSPDIWRADECLYLEILQDQMVRGACNSVSDLFDGRPYEREQRCLLNYVGDVPATLLMREIEPLIRDQVEFRGSGRISKDTRWRPTSGYQLLIFEMDLDSRREFLQNNRLRDNFPVKAYLLSSVTKEREFESRLRRGSHFSFHGRWQNGSFVIDTLDFGGGKRRERNVGKASEWNSGERYY